MSEPNQNLLSQQYMIVFQGHLEERRRHWFNGLDMQQCPGGETVLTGPLADQAALFGIITRIRDLGLPLLLVRRGDFQLQEPFEARGQPKQL